MPSPHFERKAREVLGDDAGRELGAMIDSIELLRGDIAELRQAMAAGFATQQAGSRRELVDASAALRNELVDANAALRKEVVDANAALRQDMAEGFATVRAQIANVRADLMKWSFVFWVGAVLAIAALAGVLRWTS